MLKSNLGAFQLTIFTSHLTLSAPPHITYLQTISHSIEYLGNKYTVALQKFKSSPQGEYNGCMFWMQQAV